jgi:hypothetical protein
MYTLESHTKALGYSYQAFEHNQNSYYGLTTYNGNQKNFYSNLIYQSVIGHTGHKFKTGVSFVYDKYNEDFNIKNFARNEVVPGAFFEYILSQMISLIWLPEFGAITIAFMASLHLPA